MKKCPHCKKTTIPMKWILFHQIVQKSCNYFECPNCKKKITTGHLFNFNWIYSPFYDIYTVTILLFILYVFYDLITGILLVLGFLIGYTILFLLQQCIVPLELSVETKCEEKAMTRIQALFSLIIIVLIISITVYELFVKPIILNKAPLS